MPETCWLQLPDGDCTDGWQNLTTQPSAPVTLIHSRKQRVGKGGNKKLLDAPHIMLLLPARLIATNPKAHGIPCMCEYTKTTDKNWLQSLLVAYLV